MSDNLGQQQQRTLRAQVSPTPGKPGNYQQRTSVPRHPQQHNHSLDFFDVTTHANAPIRSPSTGIDQRSYLDSAPSSTVVRPISWNSSSHGQASSTSESRASIDELEEDEDEEFEQQPGTSGWDGVGSNDATLTKRKMKRFRLTHNQTRYLMNEFIKQPHPDSAHREYLSKEIPGLSPRQVQVWFQNRRAKLKRLSVDDRERMLKSRAIPEELEPAHKAQSIASSSSVAATDPVEYSARSPLDGTSSLRRVTTNDSYFDTLSPSRSAALQRSSQPFRRSDDGSEQRRRRRRVRIRRETTLVFGREVTVYVEEEANSDSSDDDIISPSSSSSALEDVEESESGQRTTLSSERQDRVLDEQPGTHQTLQDVNEWSSRPPGGTPDTISRRQSLPQADLPSRVARQRPTYTSRPSWLAGDTSAAQEPSLATAWYQSQRPQAQDRK